MVSPLIWLVMLLQNSECCIDNTEKPLEFWESYLKHNSMVHIHFECYMKNRNTGDDQRKKFMENSGFHANLDHVKLNNTGFGGVFIYSHRFHTLVV